MRKIYAIALLLFAFSTSLTYSQITILFVSDCDYLGDRADSIVKIISGTSYSITEWNATDSAAGPGFAVMSSYDLIVWYCGVDGTGLQFWNGTDSDNGNLIGYLGNGGHLWVIGTDVLYDRYGGALVTYAASDFVYDYMGLESYDVQSYADDGNLGVPALILNTTLPLVGPDTLAWSTASSWYVDGVTGRATTERVYEMGIFPYALAGEISGTYYETALNGKIMSYFFDPYEIDNSVGDRREFFQDHFDFWQNELVGINKPVAKSSLIAYPNPASGMVYFSEAGNYSLLDMTGREVMQCTSCAQFDISRIPAGVYSARNITSGTSVKLVKE